MLSFGLVITLAGFIVYLPWGDKYPVLQMSSKYRVYFVIPVDVE